MFKIAEKPTFTHRVEANMPVDGGFETQTWKTTFELIPLEDADSYSNSVADTTEFLKRIVVSMDELADAEGRPIEYNDDVRDAVLRLPWARLALLRAYGKGAAGAKEKN